MKGRTRQRRRGPRRGAGAILRASRCPLMPLEPSLLMLTYGGWSHASSRIRAAQYAAALPFRVRWLPRVPDGGGPLRRAVTKRVQAVRRARALGSADLVFAQRTFLTPAQLRRLRAPLVYDFDDALYLDAPRETAAMVCAARRVVVSTPELLPFCAEHGAEATVIPSPVDTDRIAPRQHDTRGPFTIGWMGSPWTAPYLDAIAEALHAVVRHRPETRILLVGAAPETLAGVPNVERLPWTFDGEAEALGRMSVGIMPLPDDPWTRAKGGYKLLAYMAAGLPTVGSPVGINRDIIAPGTTGLHATTPAEWTAALLRLCDDAPLRQAMGQAGRTRAVSTYSRTVCTAALTAVLTDALRC